MAKTSCIFEGEISGGLKNNIHHLMFFQDKIAAKMN